MNNLKQLTLGWIIYADDNDDKLVNGMAGRDREQDGVVSEKAWVGKDWAEGYRNGARLAEQNQLEAISVGALFPYLKAEKIYHCPKGEDGQVRTYSVVDSMNGVARDRTDEDGAWANNRTHIGKFGPHGQRVVFVDVGRAIPESFAVHYDKEQWWALPPVRHVGGTTLSFADGHAEHWRWKAGETVKLGESAGGSSSAEKTVPQTAEGKEDLHKLQKGVWGKLGYTPGG
jgi:prepilin-type processing-associated H-X9-DG protein